MSPTAKRAAAVGLILLPLVVSAVSWGCVEGWLFGVMLFAGWIVGLAVAWFISCLVIWLFQSAAEDDAKKDEATR